MITDLCDFIAIFLCTFFFIPSFIFWSFLISKAKRMQIWFIENVCTNSVLPKLKYWITNYIYFVFNFIFVQV